MAKKHRRVKTSAKITVRNLAAVNPLLGKGGAHQRSAKAERQKFKARLRRGEHDHASDLSLIKGIICLVVFLVEPFRFNHSAATSCNWIRC